MNKWLLVFIHVGLWMIYLLMYATLWRLDGMSFIQSLLREFALLPMKVILVYSCIGYLVPTFLQRKKYFTFVFLTVMFSFATGILHNVYVHYILPNDVSVLRQGENFLDWERITKRMTYLNSPMFFALTIVMIRNWYEQKEQNAKIMQENLSAKLQLLKQQLQPHFFFNTLNSLYSLALQKSDQTPLMILKLSELMRYLSDKHDSNWVSLKEEINFVQNYLSLEEIRYQDKVQISCSISVQLPECIFISPLILSPFVENAFKHGVAGRLDSAFVHVEINEDRKFLYYKVCNSKSATANEINPGGSGLTNLYDRLKIVYGNDFSMQHSNDEHTYTSQLQIMKRGEEA